MLKLNKKTITLAVLMAVVPAATIVTAHASAVNGDVLIDGVKYTGKTNQTNLSLGQDGSIIQIGSETDAKEKALWNSTDTLTVIGKEIRIFSREYGSGSKKTVFDEGDRWTHIGNENTDLVKIVTKTPKDNNYAELRGISADNSVTKVNAKEIEVTATVDKESKTKNGLVYGLYTNNSSSSTIQLGVDAVNTKVDITATNLSEFPPESEGAQAYGAYNNAGGQIDIGNQKSTVTVTAKAKDKAVGLYSGASVSGTSALNVYGQTLGITADSGSVAVGITSDKGAQITVGSQETNSLNVTATGKNSAIGLNVVKASDNVHGATLNGRLINITATSDSDSTAVYVGSGGSATIGSETTEKVELKGTANGTGGKEYNWTVWVSGDTSGTQGGDLTIKGKTIEISAKGAGTTEAVHVATANLDAQKHASLKLEGDNIILKAESTTPGQGSVGISAMSGGQVSVVGNTVITADHAILARGGAKVDVNVDTSKTTKLNGDIVFNYDNDTSKSGVDAFVNVNLSGADSYWEGNSYVSWASQGAVEDSKLDVNNLRISLSNEAKWIPTIVENKTEEGGGQAYQALNYLIMDGGAVDLQSHEVNVTVENLSGTGGTINATVTKAADGTLTSGAVVVEKVDTTSATPAMTVNYTGVTSDDMTTKNTSQLKALKAAETAEAALDKVTITETAPEGDLYGKWERKTQGDKVTESRGDNTKLQKFDAVNAIAFVEWRNEINHLTKRLGDVRASDGNLGGWARVYGGESRWGSNSIEVDHQTVQVGADTRVNNEWLVGGAFSYTHSDGTYAGGETNGDGYSLAGYATYLADNGVYVDVIARYGYLKNDMKADNMAINTANNAFSLSTEMGHQFRWNDRAYIEPQVEFTYGWIGGDKATASNNVRIEQDDYQSFITRVGVRSGFDFPNKAGTIYGMASYAYDFLGDADGTASKDGQSVALHEDLGGGWFTYGLGAQFAVGKSAYVYGELERTSGGEVENPYMFNVGARIFF